MTIRQVTLVVWGALGALVVVLQVAAVRSAGGFPGLGALLDRVTRRRLGQIAAVLGWMWLGWHAFAR